MTDRNTIGAWSMFAFVGWTDLPLSDMVAGKSDGSRDRETGD